MARGRKPVPTALKVLRGNPGKRPLTKDEPQPPPLTEGTLPPAWLSDRAKDHWRETVPALVALGLFTELDQWSWALACAAWGHWRELAELIERDGMILPSQDGGKMHPALRAEEKWAESYMKISREFGSTPASRVSLHVQPPQVDELDVWVNRHKARSTPKADKARFFNRSKDGEAN